MKRDAYGDGGEGGLMHKRPRHSDDEVTFLIPSKVAGSVIGKGGVNISKLRNQYKASITVPDCPGPERVLSITASDLDTTLEIVKEILPKLVDHEHSQGGPKGGNGEDLDIRMLIHQSRAGCVIGKAGAKIKELREKTGARLKIFSNAAPQSTERVVQLVGSEECVAAGVREVLDLIRQTPIKGPIQTYDPHNYDDFYAEEYGGFGAGQGGPGPAGGRGRGPGGPGGPRGPPPGMAGPGGPEFGGRGGGGGGSARGGAPPPRGRFEFPPPPARAPYSHPHPHPHPPAPFQSAPAGRAPHAAAHHQHEQTTQVTIPKDLAGAIIGKAGTRIRKIRLESGAGIEIAEPLPGAGERVITISGTPPRIQMAQYLLQQSVHESNPNLGGGGGGGRGGNF